MKKILKIFFALLALVIIAFGIFLWTFDINQYKDDIVQLVQNKTGRDFRIEGELKLGISLIPTVVVEGVKFGNAKWGSQPDMLSVGRFEAQVSLMPLLNKNVQVNRLILISPEILLETNKEGVGNWVIATKPAATPEKTAPAKPVAALPVFTINNVQIENGSLTYKDGMSGKSTKVTIEKFNASTPSFGDPMEVLLSAAYNEIPITLDGTLGSLDSLLENKDFTVNIKAGVSDAKLALNGKIAQPMQAKGLDVGLTFHTPSLSTFEKLAGKKLPAISPVDITGHLTEQEGAYHVKDLKVNLGKVKIGLNGKIMDPERAKGLDLVVTFNANSLTDLNEMTGSKMPAIGPIALSTGLKDKDGAYQLSGMKLTAGTTDLAGDMTLNMSGKRPALTAKLDSNKIDLTPFTGKEEKDKEEKSKKEKVKKEKLFPSGPLPLEGLKAADANVNINAKQILTTDLVLESVKLVLTLNNGKLALKPLNANVAGGTLSTTLNLDASSGKTAALDTNIDIKGFQPSTLPDLKDKLTGGKTDIKINAKGSGNSVAAIMAGLNGNLLLTMGEGKLKSSEADKASSDVFLKTYRMLNPSAAGDQDTQIKCGVAKFDIKDGIATTDKGIALATNKMNVIGSGSVNLKTEALDIGVTPQAREGVGISAGQLAELVRLQGTLANPETGIDTKAAVMAGVSAGAAVATGGLSILAQGLFDRATADEDPCATALGLKTAKKSTPPPETKEEAPKSVTEKATDTVKDAGTAIKDTFKGLFGD